MTVETVVVMSVDRLSIVFANATTGLAFGLSMTLALELLPWFREKKRELWLLLLVVIWAFAARWAFMLDVTPSPAGEWRRFINGLASLWISWLLFLHYRKHRKRHHPKDEL